jgi:hypothetical protein
VLANVDPIITFQPYAEQEKGTSDLKQIAFIASSVAFNFGISLI